MWEGKGLGSKLAFVQHSLKDCKVQLCEKMMGKNSRYGVDCTLYFLNVIYHICSVHAKFHLFL